MRRLLYLIGQLLAAALVIIVATIVWIVFDGLTDLGDKTGVGLVFSDPASPKHASQVRLDRVIELHKDGDFSAVIVSGDGEETDAMAKYLANHGIPASTIIQADVEENAPDWAKSIAEEIKSHNFSSVMIVTDYYYVTRTKLELSHEGINEIQKAHVGTLRTQDAWKIGNEVVALYDYIAKTYLFPAAEKVKQEAQVGMDKAKADADAAKKKVDEGLDTLPK